MRTFERVHPASRAEWRAWLEANHAVSPSVWLVSYKKGTGRPRVEGDAAVEEALCFGWIDSLPRKLDEERSMPLFSPRKPASAWSKINKDRVERLIAAGLMHEAGFAKIEAAKANGRWNALDAVDALIVPDDLAGALDAHPNARAAFAGFPPSVRRGILEWIGNAKLPETRVKRVAETARLAGEGRRANQWRGG